MTRWYASGQRRPVIGVVVTFVSALVLAGCAATESESSASAVETAVDCTGPYSGFQSEYPDSYPEPAKQDLTIGWVNPIGTNYGNSQQQAAAKIEAERLGGRLVPVDSAGQTQTQVQVTTQLINQGVDAIVVWPLDVTALKPIIERANAAGIPVIGYAAWEDEADKVDGYATNVAYGYDGVAYEQISHVVGQTPGAEVLLSEFASPVPALVYFVEQSKSWAAQCGANVIDTIANSGDDASGASKTLTPALQKYPNASWVIGYNDPTAIGAGIASKLTGVPVKSIGQQGDQDGYNAVESGQMAATVQIDQIGMAVEAIRGAYAVVQGIDVPDTVWVRPKGVVTEEKIKSGSMQSNDDILADFEKANS
ncbi:sugar ABC transporter substrate-binding protein [Rhodococcus sp. NPDC055024]